jgi:HD superfamily phosphohydrolase
MDYIDGLDIDKYWNSCSAEGFLQTLDQLIDALGHLHSRGYYHMDVKEENIRVQSLPRARPQAVLLDLGGAKQVHSLEGMQLSDKTVYISTRKATRQNRRDYLGQRVDRSLLATWGLDLDFYAVGAILERARANNYLRQVLKTQLGDSGLAALDWIEERLTEDTSDGTMRNRHYQTASQLQTDFKRLPIEYTWPLGLPELSLVGAEKSTQLSDKRVWYTDQLQAVIDHPVVQRLRSIPQLEYISQIYPNATHTRFAHALDTLHIARLYLSRLLQFPEIRMMAGREHVRATLLLALLHDIGHYPLSHMFEDFAAALPSQLPDGIGPVPSDDDLFKSLVSPPPGDVFHGALERALPTLADEPPFDKPLGELLRREFEASYPLLIRIMHPGWDATEAELLLHSLLDSVIDVDKVAYLIADSTATGVRFGHGIDLQGLLQALRPPAPRDRRRGAIAITEDGLAAAEGMVQARFAMVSRAYWVRTNRAIMAMHKFTIADLMDRKQFTFPEYFERTLFMTQSEATRWLMERYKQAHELQGPMSPNEVANPLIGILPGNRKLYKCLLTISHGPSDSDRQLYERIRADGPLSVLTVGEALRDRLRRDFSGLRWRHGDVLVDIPWKERDVLGANVLVYLDSDPENGRNLAGRDNPVSPALQGLPDNFEFHVKKCRVFVHPSLMRDILARGLMANLRQSAREYLHARYKVARTAAT